MKMRIIEKGDSIKYTLKSKDTVSETPNQTQFNDKFDILKIEVSISLLESKKSFFKFCFNINRKYVQHHPNVLIRFMLAQ